MYPAGIFMIEEFSQILSTSGVSNIRPGARIGLVKTPICHSAGLENVMECIDFVLLTVF